MSTRDPRVDAYIANAPAFARSILEHLRASAHDAEPGIEETIKWHMPFFTLDGKPVCGMAAFKAHCAFVLWRDRGEAAGDGMGAYGRIATLADVPSRREVIAGVRRVIAAQRSGARKPARPHAKPKLAVPADLAAAIARSAKACRTFDAFPPGHRRDYVEWIVEAKRVDTRARRIAQAIEWLKEGKTRNWRYEKR